MKRLEIIHLRSSAKTPEILGERIQESIERSDAEAIGLYRREGLETDLAVHIHHSGEANPEGFSSLGLRLASALSAFGLVEHSLWEEMK